MFWCETNGVKNEIIGVKKHNFRVKNGIKIEICL